MEPAAVLIGTFQIHDLVAGLARKLGPLIEHGKVGDARIKPDIEHVGDFFIALGILAKQGRGMPASEEVAARWMKQAAAAGNLPGEVEYAIMLFNGTGVEKDETAAANLFLRAAWQGNPIAPRVGKKRKSGNRQKAQAA